MYTCNGIYLNSWETNLFRDRRKLNCSSWFLWLKTLYLIGYNTMQFLFKCKSIIPTQDHYITLNLHSEIFLGTYGIKAKNHRQGEFFNSSSPLV